MTVVNDDSPRRVQQALAGCRFFSAMWSRMTNREMQQLFDLFAAYVGPAPADVAVDWTGAKFRCEWAGWQGAAASKHVAPQRPEIDEEFFEWLDLLEAVHSSRDRFVMVELGAGFGRWGIRGSLLAQQRGLTRIDVRFVEAEPQHAAWLREAVSLNHLTENATVVEGALCYSQAPVPFLLSHVKECEDPAAWYGQALWQSQLPETGEIYCGKRIYGADGYRQVLVDPVTLRDLIADVDVVDFLDADLQGAEIDLVQNDIDVMTARVRSVHIGTHGVEIENAIRSAFCRAGWINRWDFSLQATHETPHGIIDFGDGVQS
jgi:hypothetical protein